jgi:hypothetical protein
MARSSLTFIPDFSEISSPLFSILSLVAILVGSRDQRTQIWKGAIQESFQQSLVDIGSVVSEEKIFFNFSFSRYIPIMQIRHILIKDHI